MLPGRANARSRSRPAGGRPPCRRSRDRALDQRVQPARSGAAGASPTNRGRRRRCGTAAGCGATTAVPRHRPLADLGPQHDGDGAVRRIAATSASRAGSPRAGGRAHPVRPARRTAPPAAACAARPASRRAVPAGLGGGAGHGGVAPEHAGHALADQVLDLHPGPGVRPPLGDRAQHRPDDAVPRRLDTAVQRPPRRAAHAPAAGSSASAARARPCARRPAPAVAAPRRRRGLWPSAAVRPAGRRPASWSSTTRRRSRLAGRLGQLGARWRSARRRPASRRGPARAA